MKNQKVLFLTHAAMIAALYVVLTYVANMFGLASGAIQVRLSEMLIILPVFTPAAIPGLFIGCLLSNLLTGCCILDILMGSLATLLGATGAYLLRKWKWAVPLPNIAANSRTICTYFPVWLWPHRRLVVSDHHCWHRRNHLLWHSWYDPAAHTAKIQPQGILIKIYRTYTGGATIESAPPVHFNSQGLSYAFLM